jgi:DNA-directed RNA polymerase subunit L
MLMHEWKTENDLSYCELTNVTFDSSTGNITLDDDSLTGSLITEVKDSTKNFHHYGEFIADISTPFGTDLTYYYKTSDDPDDMGDWIELEVGAIRYENCMSLFNYRVMTDYDINILVSILEENNYRDGYDVYGNSYIDSAIVGEAQVGLASDYTNYATDASVYGNMITLASDNLLDEHQVNLFVAYTTKHPVIEADNRYVQFKVEFETDTLTVVPSISNIEAYYTTNIKNRVDRQFPMFYRRL